jgi:hypothetical protein
MTAALDAARGQSRLRSRPIEARGVRLHVIEAGAADAPTIMLQHG